MRELVDITDLDGLVAVEGDEWLGYASYRIDPGSMEIAVLESLRTNRGIASALVARCVSVALKRPLERLWLITTNDNLHALRFYQRRGFVLLALHRGNATWARQHLKPEIPVLGLDDIPIRDELELELPRAVWPDFVARYGV
ncbi:MAG TPA: GNAT family N-acetyltransferase [Candidatus Limnocylindrales bacterium]|nr:GNAT family N-acetyltransferase [Candidatus Limnocylindrales bacterium]